MTNKSLTLAVAVAALASLSAKAQIIAYDNTTGYLDTVTARGNAELGDEIHLTTGPTTLTRFQFEYNYSPGFLGDTATGILRLWAKDADGGFRPGTLLLQSTPFTLVPGFNQGDVNGLSLDVPGTLIWTVDFDGITGTESAGLLFYGGVGVGSGPGQSQDDHWENQGTVAVPDWALMITDGIVDNFGARVTVVPEPTTVGLLVGGAALLGFAARRRKA
jgi:hypothetical protein